MKKSAVAFMVAGVWVAISEFVRNELAFKSYWIEKYAGNSMVFPSEAANNALWGLWSFMLSGVVVFLLHRLRFVETILVTWFVAFVMMWVVIGNLNVLPPGLLAFAIPWSFVEVTIATWLGKKILGEGSSSVKTA
jgi:hypothetical protein